MRGTANLYLSEVDTKFWIAYYPKVSSIPSYWYFDTKQEAASNTILNKKTIAWQFTENGIKDVVLSQVDLSLFKNSFLEAYLRKLKEIMENKIDSCQFVFYNVANYERKRILKEKKEE